MCGIAGLWQKNEKNLKSRITKMTDTLSHRGPDDSGIYVDKKNCIALGHRRLSILDLSPAGHQPMKSFSGRYIIVYNGEIYNYHEIKKELEIKYNIKFKSDSDTEIILSCIEIWGLKKSLQKFNGMFAFALWDKKIEKLYLVRDRIGIKPLYYGIQNKTLLFASELKAIRVNKSFQPILNRDALTLFFRHNYIPTPYSIYKGIKKLTPGYFVTIDKNLNMQLECYWDIYKITENNIKNLTTLSRKEAISRLENLLLDSVKKRMISDVPLGAFLSGGIDSSTIVALMQAQSNIPIKTFTIGFYEKKYNEATFAKEIAKYLKTDHTELYLTYQKAMEIIPKLPNIYDEPFSDSSQIPTFLISQLAHKDVTVSLSGDGGDELFGGYKRYFLTNKIWNKIKLLPHFIKRDIIKLISVIPPERWNTLLNNFNFIIPKKLHQTLYGDKLYKLLDILNKPSDSQLYKALISHWKYPENLVINSKEPNTVFDNKKIDKNINNFTDKMMFFDLITYLPDDILVKVDRASMSMGLETRVPILDHRIVEFSKKLPLSLKIKEQKSKWILRQILYKYVPKKLIERPKMGFGVPINDWIKGPLKEWAEDLLNENKLKQDGFLNFELIRKRWQEHINQKRNWGGWLWDVLMFQSWKKKWM